MYKYLLFIIFGIILYLLLNNIENLKVELDFDGTNRSVDITDLNSIDSSRFSLKDNGFEILNLVDNEYIKTLTEQFYTDVQGLGAARPEINFKLLELIKIYSLVNIEDDIKIMTSGDAAGGVAAPVLGGGAAGGAAAVVSLPRKVPETLMYIYNGNVYQMIAHDLNLRPQPGEIFFHKLHTDYYIDNKIYIYNLYISRRTFMVDYDYLNDFDISDENFIFFNVWIPIHGNDDELVVNNGLTLADMSQLDNTSDLINKDGYYIGLPVYSEKFNNDVMYSLIPQKLNDAYIFDTQKTLHGSFLNPEYTDDRSRVSIETRIACRLLNTVFVTFEHDDTIGATFPHDEKKNIRVSYNENRNEKFGDIPNNSTVLFVERGDELHNLKNMTRDIKREIFTSRPLTLCILI